MRSTVTVSRELCASFVKICCIKGENPQETNAPAICSPKSRANARLRTLVGSSEAIRLLQRYSLPLFFFLILYFFDCYAPLQLSLFFTPLTLAEDSKRFNEWLAGLIDGDGCFLLSKKKYASLEIVVELRDKRCLYEIKQKFGGAIQLRAGNNHLRYRLHSRKGLLVLIAAVNGQIRNPVRISQLNKICVEYGLPLLFPEPLQYRSG